MTTHLLALLLLLRLLLFQVVLHLGHKLVKLLCSCSRGGCLGSACVLGGLLEEICWRTGCAVSSAARRHHAPSGRSAGASLGGGAGTAVTTGGACSSSLLPYPASSPPAKPGRVCEAGAASPLFGGARCAGLVPAASLGAFGGGCANVSAVLVALSARICSLDWATRHAWTLGRCRGMRTSLTAPARCALAARNKACASLLDIAMQHRQPV